MSNLNDDRPDQVLAGFFRDQLSNIKDIDIESSKQLDNITVWLVSMSTGTIALIISQFGKFNPELYTTLKIGIFFLTITITCGLLFRILHLYLQERYKYDHLNINSWLIGYSESSSEVPIELPEDASLQYIAFCLYKHMGIEMDPDYFKFIETDNDIEYWRNQYTEYTASYLDLKKSKDAIEKNMMEKIFEFIANLEGLSPQKFERNVETDKSLGIRKRRLKKVCKLSYILMCGCFAVAVLFISCSFIATDYKANNTSATAAQQQISPSDQVQSAPINKTE